MESFLGVTSTESDRRWTDFSSLWYHKVLFLLRQFYGLLWRKIIIEKKNKELKYVAPMG